MKSDHCISIAPVARYALLFFILLNNISLFASDHIIDSLKQELNTAVDTQRVHLLYDLLVETNTKNLEDALTYGEEGLDLSKKIGYEYGIGLSTYGKGYIYHLKEDRKTAEELYNESARIFEKLGKEKNLSEAYSRLGHLYTLKGEFQRSIDIYEKALAISMKLKDDRNTGVITFSMANSYSYLGQSQKGLELMQKSRSYITHRPHLINYFAILADLYRQSGSPDKAIPSFYDALEICEEEGDSLRMAYVCQAIAQTFAEVGHYEKAGEYYFKTIALNESIQSPALTLVSHLGLGKMYFQWKDYDKSLEGYSNALEVAKKDQLSEKIPACYIGMGKVRAIQGDHQEALKYFEDGLAVAEEIALMEAVLECRIKIGETYIALDNPERALEILNSTMTLVPPEFGEIDCTFSSLYAAIAKAHKVQGKFQKSISKLNKGLENAERCSNMIDKAAYYKQLSSTYQQANNNQQALFYLNQYLIINDSLQNAENREQMVIMRIQRETEEKEQAIALLKKEREIQTLTMANQEAEIGRKETFLFILGILLALTALLSWLFFNRYKLRKKTEQLELKNRQIALEKKNLATSQQLEMAELRSNLFTDISHELRTPLTLLLAPIGELLGTAQTQEKKETYYLMQRNANRLEELVNQTLDFSKLDSGQLPLQLESCSIANLVHRLAHTFAPMAKSQQVKLEVIDKTDNGQLICDRDKIEKALSNLLSNAFEHTPSGGQVSVTLLKEEDTFTIQVSDTGKGIPEQHHGLIFNRFYQIDNRSRKGSGIGLALTRELVKLHKGSIEIESQEGEGTTFIIKLPLQLEGHSKSRTEDRAVKAQPGQLNSSVRKVTVEDVSIHTNGQTDTVLVVEDHIDLREYLVQLLLGKGYQVISAANGKKAMNLAIQFSPELVISDVMMPEVDGFEFASRLKKEFLTSHIPIILLTAKANQESKLEGLGIGVDDYLTKPFHAEELLARCRNLIAQRRQLRKLFEADPSIANKKVTSNVMDEQFLKQAILKVEERIGDVEFNVEKFCHEIGMSHTKLYNKIKALTGKNISEFIRMIRLRKAGELIENNSGNMFEIATQVGFNTRQAFNKSFKEHFGLTPSNYKKIKRTERGSSSA